MPIDHTTLRFTPSPDGELATRTTDIRTIVHQGQTIKVRATYGIRHTNRSYFFITGEVWEESTPTTAEADSMGQTTEEILAAFPELSDMVKVHLCDAYNGEPLHAAANGWYWLKAGDIDMAAHSLRVDPRRLMPVPPKKQFDELIEKLRHEWATRAIAVRTAHNLTI